MSLKDRWVCWVKLGMSSNEGKTLTDWQLWNHNNNSDLHCDTLLMLIMFPLNKVNRKNTEQWMISVLLSCIWLLKDFHYLQTMDLIISNQKFLNLCLSFSEFYQLLIQMFVKFLCSIYLSLLLSSDLLFNLRAFLLQRADELSEDLLNVLHCLFCWTLLETQNCDHTDYCCDSMWHNSQFKWAIIFLQMVTPVK